LEKCIGYRLKSLDIVQKIWAPLRKLFALPGDPSWLRAWFLPQMKIPNWKDSLCQGWRDLWMLLFRAKRIRCLMPLAHNGSCVFGAMVNGLLFHMTQKNGFFWHPWVVWKFLERLRLWAFRTCTGCKS